MKKCLSILLICSFLLHSCSKKEANEQADEVTGQGQALSAGFTVDNPDQVKEGFPAQFRSSSAAAVSFKWDFGNGELSTERNPVHTFEGCGTHTVKLLVKDAGGNQKMISAELIVNCTGKHAQAGG